MILVETVEKAEKYVYRMVENSKQDIRSEIRPILEREDIQDVLVAVFLDGYNLGQVEEARKHIKFKSVVKKGSWKDFFTHKTEFHPKMDIKGTTTFRFSSTEPNISEIPQHGEINEERR